MDEFHRELGKIMWDYVGMGRNAEGLTKSDRGDPDIREEFWKNVSVVGSDGPSTTSWSAPAGWRTSSSSAS